MTHWVTCKQIANKLWIGTSTIRQPAHTMHVVNRKTREPWQAALCQKCDDSRDTICGPCEEAGSPGVSFRLGRLDEIDSAAPSAPPSPAPAWQRAWIHSAVPLTARPYSRIEIRPTGCYHTIGADTIVRQVSLLEPLTGRRASMASWTEPLRSRPAIQALSVQDARMKMQRGVNTVFFSLFCHSRHRNVKRTSSEIRLAWRASQFASPS